MINKKCPECRQVGHIRETKESGTLKTVYRCDYKYRDGSNCVFVGDENTFIGDVWETAKIGTLVLGAVAAAAAIFGGNPNSDK